MADTADLLISLSRELCDSVSRLRFDGSVTHVYNPLDYAREGWEQYVRLAATGPRRIVLLGMNPGPWGMAQTGVPFGEVAAVRDWMGLHFGVGSPASPHPRRPIQGLSCARSEVSGRRLWGLMADRFGDANRFFSGHFVANYCPLVFMAGTGRNVTPDKLPAVERSPLFELCDGYLVRTIEALRPEFVIGVGKFALRRIQIALATGDVSDPSAGLKDITIGSILHPSPASPAANRGWAPVATRQMVELGAWQ